MGTIPDVVLNDGRHIPQLGFGTFLVEPEDTFAAVTAALEAGYRHIDTAEMYGNEREVGAAIRESGLARDDVYVTSKLNNGLHRPDDARRAFDGTLAALGMDKVDLFLIHWPLPTLYDGDYVSTWRTLEEFHRDGRARSIGVSNFEPAHLRRLADETGTVPAVNQVEVHPWLPNNDVRAWDRDHGVATEVWSPLARGRLLSDPVVERVAEAVRATPAQVILAWHLRRGDIVLVKTLSPDRMRENLAAFGVELSEADMQAIDGLDRGPSGRIGPHPDTMDWIPA